MHLVVIHDKIVNFDRYSSIVEQDIMGGVMGQPMEGVDAANFRQFSEEMKGK